MHTRTSIIRAGALALTVTLAPVKMTPTQIIAANNACAQTVKTPGTGTCCYQSGAYCITPTGNIPSNYYKPEGRCP
jgi:hypothetical protein